MTKTIFIDASHREETRMALLNEGTLQNFEYEAKERQSSKGDILLATVTRVEPSLQAAFVSFGGNRDGFLTFDQIHPDYYRIPLGDRQALLDELSQEANTDDESEDGDTPPHARAQKHLFLKKYKIQEVIQRKQLVLVQVVKDERSSKGAALTTYLSLPGRYCVLMPNTPKSIGLSRKIEDKTERTRLKGLLESLQVPPAMGLILRTAGKGCSKAELKRDYDYLSRLWQDIRTKTVDSTAPCAIYREGNLLKKTLRDIYSSDVETVWVEGQAAYEEAKVLMKKLMPSHVKRLKLHDSTTPLFQQHGLEDMIQATSGATVQLPSGGYLVFGTTEALTAIDVNSGKATRERHIDETALKTNLEAADEIARQLRLRDLGGLIVIDFIDMSKNSHNAKVERQFEQALREDRARTQVLRINALGLLHMSRQRLKPSLDETMRLPCPHCKGEGTLPSLSSAALQALRKLELAASTHDQAEPLTLIACQDVILYLTNHKRAELARIEEQWNCAIHLKWDATLGVSDFHLAGEESSDEAAKPARRRQGTRRSDTSRARPVENTPLSEPTSPAREPASTREPANERPVRGTREKPALLAEATPKAVSVSDLWPGLNHTRRPIRAAGQTFKKKFAPPTRPMLLRDASYGPAKPVAPKPTESERVAPRRMHTEKRDRGPERNSRNKKPFGSFSRGSREDRAPKMEELSVEQSLPADLQPSKAAPAKRWWQRLFE